MKHISRNVTRIKKLSPVALALVFSMHVHASSKLNIPDSDIKTARLVESIVDATPIKRKGPKYPSSAAKRGKEGWVQMSFIIDTDGSVLEPTVIDSAGDVAFERAALRAIKKWKYTPAEKDGEAIQQCDTKLQFDFSINNNGVSKKFSTFYNSAAKLLENKEADKLGLELANAEWAGESNLTEITWFHYLQSEYYFLIGDKKNELKHLYKATQKPKHDKYNSRLPEATTIRNLHRMFIIEADEQRFNDALYTFNSLKHFKSEQAIKTKEALAPFVEKIEQHIASDNLIIRDANLTKAGTWSHRLSRNSFVIQDINGDLDKLDVRCDNKRNVFTIEENNQWLIPTSWGKCQVLIDGNKGASFKLIELNS